VFDDSLVRVLWQPPADKEFATHPMALLAEALKQDAHISFGRLWSNYRPKLLLLDDLFGSLPPWRRASAQQCDGRYGLKVLVKLEFVKK